MDWKTMINACSDVNRDRVPKCTFFISFLKKGLNGPEEIVDEMSVEVPCNIYTSHKEFQLDLLFPDSEDMELNLLLDKVNRFRNPSAAIVDETNVFPFINIVAIPNEFQGQYYFICLDAYAVGLTSYSTKELPNIIRFNFDIRNNDVILMEDESIEEDEFEEDEEMEEAFFENKINEGDLEQLGYVGEEIVEEIEDEDDDLY